MAVVSMKQFLEAGAHFGHQTRRWHPKMKPYIYGAANGIHIIDLQKTLRKLREAYEFVRDISSKGESVLFVGTKLQARDIVMEEAQRSDSFYINERWLGGLMTNFNTIKQSIAKLKRLEELRDETGAYPTVIKKEALQLEKQRIKLEKGLGGIKEMRRLPGAIFVIDCKKERIALQEAQKLGVPIVAVVDTNCDPEGIDYVIPGNDDAVRAIRLFNFVIANAVLEGRAIHDAKMRAVQEEQEHAQKQAKSREAAKAAAAAAAAAAPPPTEAAAPAPAEPAAEATSEAAATPPSPAPAAEPAAPPAEPEAEAPDSKPAGE
jgi:small subunit ribosomal protein S2